MNPTPALHVLVVCLGNLCRSPLAAALLQARLDRGGGVDVTSAGLIAPLGEPMEEYAAAEAARLGLDVSEFRSRRLSAAMLRESQVVLTATRELRSQVLALEPAVLLRTFTVRELAALVALDPDGSAAPDIDAWIRALATRRAEVADLDLDIPDPMGKSPQVHRAVADLVDREVAAVARGLARAVTCHPEREAR